MLKEHPRYLTPLRDLHLGEMGVVGTESTSRLGFSIRGNRSYSANYRATGSTQGNERSVHFTRQYLRFRASLIHQRIEGLREMSGLTQELNGYFFALI